MARIIRPLRKALLFPSSSSSSPSKVLALQLQQPLLQFAEEKPLSFFKLSPHSTRTYISEMRKSAFDGNILRLLRNEIQYEIEGFPPHQPVTAFDSFTVDERPGEQWISLKRKYGENEDIKVEVTMFDGAIPGQTPVAVVLEIICFTLPWLSISPRKVVMSWRSCARELDDQLQDSLYEFLEARGISDELAVFLHEYMRNKDKAEFIGWLGTLKSFIENN
ncbi:hypothetical protein FNV43_RR07044 [Rhamnella rubrinervis]|uniref:Mitochondrial glycoprotein n=1 Tax=Rhamnella rubrinervis TaxID=2594499 RepID=A0A8K0HEL9_9ROSA|nr:hypothetical protein FNV43_RR07044 [Rhamnella rubrinervis]